MKAEQFFPLVFLALLISACASGSKAVLGEATVQPSTSLSSETALPTSHISSTPPLPALPVTPSATQPDRTATMSNTPTKLYRPLFKTPLSIPSLTGTPQAQDLAEMAIDDLAGRLGVERDSVQLIQVIFTELTPEALKCAAGNAGIQVPMIVFGYEIILQAEGRLYRYLGHGRQVIYCPGEF